MTSMTTHHESKPLKLREALEAVEALEEAAAVLGAEVSPPWLCLQLHIENVTSETEIEVSAEPVPSRTPSCQGTQVEGHFQSSEPCSVQEPLV